MFKVYSQEHKSWRTSFLFELSFDPIDIAIVSRLQIFEIGRDIFYF